MAPRVERLERPRDRSPLGASALVALAVHPSRAGSLAVADRAGNIWRTETAGASWRALREPGSGAGLPTREDLLLDLDVRLSELADRAQLDDPSRDFADDGWRWARLRDELLAEQELLPGFVFRDPPGADQSPVALRFVDGAFWAELPDGWWIERDRVLVPAQSAPPEPAPAPPPPEWMPDATAGLHCAAAPPVALAHEALFELRADGPRRVEALGAAPLDATLACDASGSLWLLTPEALWVFQSPIAVSVRPDTLDLRALSEAAAARPGLRPHYARSRRTLAAVTPSLVAEASLGSALVDRWSLPLGTVGQELIGSGVVVRAVWQPRAPRRTAVWRARGDLVVVDGRVIPLTGRDDHVAFSALARSAVRYTHQVQRAVATLVTERAALSARPSPDAPLPERVQVALAVAEVDALLDALCDGALSQAARAP